jgi:hypothetical protein
MIDPLRPRREQARSPLVAERTVREILTGIASNEMEG